MNRKAVFSYGCILIAAALWGGIGISVRYISGFGLTSIQSACVRIFVTTLCLFLYLVCTDRTKLKIHLCDLKYYFGSGILSILLNNVCYAVSVRVNSLSMAAILLYTSPFIVVVFAHFVFREKMTVKKDDSTAHLFYRLYLYGGAWCVCGECADAGRSACRSWLSTWLCTL